MDQVTVTLQLDGRTVSHTVGIPRHDGNMLGRMRDGTLSMHELTDCVEVAAKNALAAWNAKRLADAPWEVTESYSRRYDGPVWYLRRRFPAHFPYMGLLTFDDVLHRRTYRTEQEAVDFAAELNKTTEENR